MLRLVKAVSAIGAMCTAFTISIQPCLAQLTFTDVTASRSIGTVYHNTGSHPLLLLMTPVNQAVGGVPANTDASLLVDSVNPPVQEVARNKVVQNFGSAGNAAGVAAIVPPGFYYQLNFTANNPPSVIAAASETSIDVSTVATQATPVRALGTVYHNTSSSVIWVEVSVSTSAGSASVTLLSDSSATPTTVIADADNDNGRYMELISPILPGNYYEVTGTNVSIADWVEVTTPGFTLTQADVTASRCENGANYTTCGGIYTAGTALFAAITSDMGSFSSAGTHVSGNGPNSSALTDIVAITRNQGQHSETLIGVPITFVYGDRNDNAGSTIGHWLEWQLAAARPPVRHRSQWIDQN